MSQHIATKKVYRNCNTFSWFFSITSHLTDCEVYAIVMCIDNIMYILWAVISDCSAYSRGIVVHTVSAWAFILCIRTSVGLYMFTPSFFLFFFLFPGPFLRLRESPKLQRKLFIFRLERVVWALSLRILFLSRRVRLLEELFDKSKTKQVAWHCSEKISKYKHKTNSKMLQCKLHVSYLKTTKEYVDTDTWRFFQSDRFTLFKCVVLTRLSLCGFCFVCL